LELSKAASSILFHILETPTSLLMRGTSLSTLGSCQLQDLQHVGTIVKSLLMRSNSRSTLGSFQLQNLQHMGILVKSLFMRSNSLSTLGSCQLQDMQHVATIINHCACAAILGQLGALIKPLHLLSTSPSTLRS
jgi:hypothetical protein